MSIEAKAATIRLLLFDVDGVLTDGKILLHADGTESGQSQKSFLAYAPKSASAENNT